MKTCFTCHWFSWIDGSVCSSGTCSDSSKMVCYKNKFPEVKSYDEGKLAEQTILKAVLCKEYEEEK